MPAPDDGERREAPGDDAGPYRRPQQTKLSRFHRDASVLSPQAPRRIGNT